jgi:hypothetical protein
LTLPQPTQAVSVADLAARVQAAIEVGEITAQHAPGGHPLFDALADGREVLAWLNDSAAFLEGGVTPGVLAYAQDAVNRIYDAAATVRTDPDLPPPATIWPEAKALPWPWIAAGAGGLLLVAILFQKRGGRRR